MNTSKLNYVGVIDQRKSQYCGTPHLVWEAQQEIWHDWSRRFPKALYRRRMILAKRRSHQRRVQWTVACSGAADEEETSHELE